MGEQTPTFTRHIIREDLHSVLEVSKRRNCQLFIPSSIAVFGDKSHKKNAPEDPILCPKSIYGVAMALTEILGLYYYNKFDIDFRSLRYPGLIFSEESRFSDVTDFATEIFYKAHRERKYVCYLKENTSLPIIYINEFFRATAELLEADNMSLTRRIYNLNGITISPGELVKEIKK